MQALRSVLDSLPDKPDSVLQLLESLPTEDFALDVHICSFGGVGSTVLSNFLNSKGLSTNLLSDEDNRRHINRPPSCGPNGPRVVVYLWGDPLTAIASHFRRGHALHQAIKTSGNHRLQAETFPSSFDAYVRAGDDLFGLEAHFHNWLHEPTTGYRIVMVRYERMFEPGVARELMRHLAGHARSPPELDALADELCAQRRPRLSQVAPDARGHMYGGLLAEMDRMPPLLVRDMAGDVVEVYGDPGPGQYL